MVGEFVDYFAYDLHTEGLQAVPALVVRDHGGGTMNLQVFGNGPGAPTFESLVPRGYSPSHWLPRGQHEREVAKVERAAQEELDALREADAFRDALAGAIGYALERGAVLLDLTESDYRRAIMVFSEQRAKPPIRLRVSVSARPLT